MVVENCLALSDLVGSPEIGPKCGIETAQLLYVLQLVFCMVSERLEIMSTQVTVTSEVTVT